MGDDKELKVLIIGAGGHAQVVADILNLNYALDKIYKPIGFIDDDESLHDQEFLVGPVLGSSEEISEIAHDGVIIAIGDNKLRAKIYTELSNQGERLINAIHPSAVIANDVTIGAGVVICGGVVVNTGTRIRNNVILNTGSTIDHHNLIHDHVHIAPGCALGGNVEIGEGTMIGIGSTVMPQKSIGAWSTIGAGAVVTNNIPDKVTAFGIPAQIKNQQSKEGKI
jgi:sugar O-acyltransferase (sialic acid O-acetyltransferase NeuD family)